MTYGTTESFMLKQQKQFNSECKVCFIKSTKEILN